MIDFSTLQGMTIPEGKVTSITRKSDGVVLWKMVASRLPSEYQEVKYVFMPSGAYINSGWVPSEGAKFNIIFKANANSYVFGCGSGPRLAAVQNAEAIQAYNTDNSTWGIYNLYCSAGELVELETYSTGSLDSYVICNGEKFSNGHSAGVNFNTSLKMLIGAWSYNASTTRHGIQKIYYVKASVKGVDAFEMIPCYRKSDGVVGMYDLVSKTFYTNAGTGDFACGPDVGGLTVNLLPSALTPDDTTTVFDGKGYKNGYYASAAEPFYNIDAAFFCSGLMPIPKGQTFYIKGCTIDTSLSHTRFGLMQQTGETINTAVLANWNTDISVETLGTQYYEITINRLVYSAVTAYYFYFSASGTGENVIVSATPITT